jgi:hypothetical protein
MQQVAPNTPEQKQKRELYRNEQKHQEDEDAKNADGDRYEEQWEQNADGAYSESDADDNDDGGDEQTQDQEEELEQLDEVDLGDALGSTALYQCPIRDSKRHLCTLRHPVAFTFAATTAKLTPEGLSTVDEKEEDVLNQTLSGLNNVSNAQLHAASMALNAFHKGRAFVCADSTGVGKTRIAAATIASRFNELHRKRCLYLSVCNMFPVIQKEFKVKFHGSACDSSLVLWFDDCCALGAIRPFIILLLLL